MADTYQHIDLNTLQRVEQLLTSADLGSGDERSNRTIPASASSGPSGDLAAGPDSLAPLPQRR